VMTRECEWARIEKCHGEVGSGCFMNCPKKSQNIKMEVCIEEV